jgi:hypothetical protein
MSKVKACQAIDAISTGIQAFLARVAWAAPARTNEASASDATYASVYIMLRFSPRAMKFTAESVRGVKSSRFRLRLLTCRNKAASLSRTGLDFLERISVALNHNWRRRRACSGDPERQGTEQE